MSSQNMTDPRFEGKGQSGGWGQKCKASLAVVSQDYVGVGARLGDVDGDAAAGAGLSLRVLQTLLQRSGEHLHDPFISLPPSPFTDFVLTLLSANTFALILAPSALSAGGQSQVPPLSLFTPFLFLNWCWFQ